MNRNLLIGAAVLVGIGGMLGAAGVLLGTTATVSAARDWLRQLDEPPTETAKRTWRQAVAAGRAGANAWQGEIVG